MDLDSLRLVIRAHDYLGPPQTDHEVMLESVGESLTAETRLVHLAWKRVLERGRKRRRKGEERNLPRPEEERPFELSVTADLSRLSSLESAIAETEGIARGLEEHFSGHHARITRHAVDILPGQVLLGDMANRSLKQVRRAGMTAEIVLEVVK